MTGLSQVLDTLRLARTVTFWLDRVLCQNVWPNCSLLLHVWYYFANTLVYNHNECGSSLLWKGLTPLQGRINWSGRLLVMTSPHLFKATNLRLRRHQMHHYIILITVIDLTLGRIVERWLRRSLLYCFWTAKASRFFAEITGQSAIAELVKNRGLI